MYPLPVLPEDMPQIPSIVELMPVYSVMTYTLALVAQLVESFSTKQMLSVPVKPEV